MTVIAYRSGVLAADSQLTSGDQRVPGGMVKIIRLDDGTLVGGCGDAVSIHALFEWARAGRQGKPPKVCKGGDMLIVSPDGSITQMEGRHPFTVKDNGGYFAQGSGGDVALGAMHQGANALEAVQAAIAHNVTCGGEVVHLVLEAPKPAKRRRKA